MRFRILPFVLCFGILTMPYLSSAASIPSTRAEVFKLLFLENYNKEFSFGPDLKFQIGEWYTDTILPEGNEDLSQQGILFSRIGDASCRTIDSASIYCTIEVHAQEFIPANSEANGPMHEEHIQNYCQGFDDFGRLEAKFERTPSGSLKFVSAELTAALSGFGPCGVETDF